MYKKQTQIRTSIEANDSVEGEPIEHTIERLLNNGDEIIEGKELLFTRAEDGVIPAFNIRHDHWDDAYQQTTLMAEKRIELDQAQLSKRKQLLKQKEEEDKYLRDQANKAIKPQENNNPSGE